MKTLGGGGSRKSSKVTRGDHFGEATFKGGDRLKFTSFSPKSSPLPPPHDEEKKGATIFIKIAEVEKLRRVRVWMAEIHYLKQLSRIFHCLTLLIH